MSEQPAKVIHYYARFGEHKSGVTESIATWLRITSRSYSTELWMAARRSRRSHRDLKTVQDLSTLITEVPHLGRRRQTYLPLLPWWRIRRGDVFVVHEGWVLSNSVAVAVARARGAVCISVPHGVYEPQLVKSLRDVLGVRRFVERMTLRSLNGLHVFYPTEVELAEAIAGREIPSRALPNPVPPVAPRAEWSQSEADNYFLWLGRFDVRHKGLDRLIELWAAVDSPRPRLVLAGPDFQDGKAVVRELYPAARRISSTFSSPSTESCIVTTPWRPFFSIIHPSRWESCSMVLNEMVAAGVPSLVTEAIHAAEPMRQAGLVTTYSDAASFRSGLARLQEQEVGGQQQRHRAVCFDESSVGEDYRNWLSTFIGNQQKQ